MLDYIEILMDILTQNKDLAYQISSWGKWHFGTFLAVVSGVKINDALVSKYYHEYEWEKSYENGVSLQSYLSSKFHKLDLVYHNATDQPYIVVQVNFFKPRKTLKVEDRYYVQNIRTGEFGFIKGKDASQFYYIETRDRIRLGLPKKGDEDLSNMPPTFFRGYKHTSLKTAGCKSTKGLLSVSETPDISNQNPESSYTFEEPCYENSRSLEIERAQLAVKKATYAISDRAYIRPEGGFNRRFNG